MSYRLGRWEDAKQPAGAHVRQELIDAHVGDYRSLLRRHERAAIEAAQGGKQAMLDIAPRLQKRVADTRNLRVAFDYLRQYGGQAPGPNGLTYAELTDSEVWGLLRVLRQLILDGTYRTGPDRKVSIPKARGGVRTLRLQNIEDRVVARGVVQIIQPLLDPIFDDRSYGYRPGRGRLHALAETMRLFDGGRRVLVVADIRDAFEHVPIQRLMDVVRLRLPGAEDLWNLTQNILAKGSKRGIRQGSPLSPVLLNLYLDHFTDRQWRKLLPETPLLRTADDMLIMCRTESEALQAYATLHRLLGNAGLQLKESQEEAVHVLANGDVAEYLGYQLQQHGEDLELRIAEDIWFELWEKLERAHHSSAPPLRAVAIIEGLVDQLGPCYPCEDGNRVHARVAEIAGELAFDEIPDCATLLQRWRASHARWCRLRTHMDAAARTVGGGSACPRDFSAHGNGRGGGARKGALPPSFSFSEVTLYTDGCCLSDRRGGWAFILKSPDLSRSRRLRYRKPLQRTTNNRAELLAVINGLQAITSTTPVTIVVDSDYVARGINDFLPSWKLRGWKAGSGKHKRPLKNVDLWQQLDQLLAGRRYRCLKIAAHTGHPENEECDRLARQAALR